MPVNATIDDILQAYVDYLSAKSREFFIEDPSVTDRPSVDRVYVVEEVQEEGITVAVLPGLGMIQSPEWRVVCGDAEQVSQWIDKLKSNLYIDSIKQQVYKWNPTTGKRVR